MDKEDPEQLFEIFEDTEWYNQDNIIRDITDKLREFGYSTVDASKYASDGECYINFVCEHGTVCGHIWIWEDEDEDEGYKFDISDEDANDGSINECPMCKKVKTIRVCNQKTTNGEDKIILDKKTVEEIIKLIESEEYYITNDEIIISDEDGIVLTLRDVLKGKHEIYKVNL